MNSFVNGLHHTHSNTRSCHSSHIRVTFCQFVYANGSYTFKLQNIMIIIIPYHHLEDKWQFLSKSFLHASKHFKNTLITLTSFILKTMLRCVTLSLLSDTYYILPPLKSPLFIHIRTFKLQNDPNYHAILKTKFHCGIFSIYSLMRAVAKFEPAAF